MSSFPFRNNPRRHSAFTLIEVMVALTLTLLMMLALARAFKMIGLRIGESQSELILNADLREITTRLRLELDKAQLTAEPNDVVRSTGGYLTYYEGPMTNQTTAHLALAKPFDPDNPDYVPRSRYGDLDDFLAFTAKARQVSGKSQTKFMGYIPYGVLAAHEFAKGKSMVSSYQVANYDRAAAVSLVPFYSEEAEIAYWLSPRWLTLNGTALSGTLRYDPTSGQPLYRDGDNDQLPDVMDLHRRVLLIRQDLNMKLKEIRDANNVTTLPQADDPLVDTEILEPDNLVEVLPFLTVTTNGQQRIVPMSSESYNGLAASTNFYSTGASYPDAPGNWSANVDTVAPDWLVGMARLQQVMDLSVSRVTNNWSDQSKYDPTGLAMIPPTLTRIFPTSPFGMPSRFVQANSVDDLTDPDRRFASVRMPVSLMTGSNSPNASSFPLLALCPPHPFMVLGEQVDWDNDFTTNDPVGFDETQYLPDVPAAAGATPGIVRDLPAQADPDGISGNSAIGVSTINPLQRYGRFTMVGFLRPEFNLQDRIVNSDGASATSIQRGRSDVIATNVLSFDIKIFDANTPSYVFVGRNGTNFGNPGVDGFNDDGDNQTDEVDEIGFVGSNDELVLIDDLNVRRAVNLTYSANYVPITNAGFVDLNFANLPGHPLGNVIGRDTINLTERQLLTGFSGVSEMQNDAGIAPYRNVFPRAQQQSGRFILRSASGSASVHSFLQPVYDTFTLNYLNDLFDQEGRAFAEVIDTDGDGNVDTVFEYGLGQGRYTVQADAGDGSGTNIVQERGVSYRTWSNMRGPSPTPPLSPDDFVLQPRDTLPDTDLNNKGRLQRLSETNAINAVPPTGTARMKAIQIQIRLYDEKADRIRQQTVIQRF